MFSRLLLLLVILTGVSHGAVARPAPLPATAQVVACQLIVAPDRADWTYAPGDPVTFTLRVLANGHPVPDAVVRYSVGPERFEQSRGEARVPLEGLKIDGGTLNQPGFLRCVAEAEIDGTVYRGLATAGFSPGAIVPTQVDPADFDAFWADRLAALAKIPVNARFTLVPEACTADVNVFQVSYDSWGIGGQPDRFFGVLTQPVKPGRYPAVLKVPGAGVRPYPGDVTLAATGLVVLEIGIHGIPVNLPAPLYDHLRQGALQDYTSYGLDDRDRYFYLRVYLACVRANEILVQHEQWDGKNLVAAGGSQGGQLAIVTSALDPRVTGTVANYPAYCDVTGYLHQRAGGWPHLLARPEHQTEAKIRTTAYYDTVNFARRLRAPGSYGWGYNDVTCPPTSTFAAYHVITAPKELWLQLDMGHASSSEFSAQFKERVCRLAGGNGKPAAR
jgi:cephalosporin-C deacetylase-like acetyl esterase